MPLFTLNDAPETLALFPLQGALLLPGARLPLNIFEPRYLAMVDDILGAPHRAIGMIQPLPGRKEESPPLYAVGCAGRLTSFSETPDGRYLISLTGAARFRLVEEVEGFAPYRRARVDFAPYAADFSEPEPDPGFDRAAFLGAFDRYVAAQNLRVDRDALKEADADMLVNALSMLLPFTPEEKQALLETDGLAERRKALMALMAFGAMDDGPEGGALQ